MKSYEKMHLNRKDYVTKDAAVIALRVIATPVLVGTKLNLWVLNRTIGNKNVH